MPSNFEFAEIAALWKNTSKKGTVYYKGKLGKSNIFAFLVESDNPKAPALRLCVTPETEDQGGGRNGGQPRKPAPQAGASGNGYSITDQRRAQSGGGYSPPNGDDIPF